MEQHEREYFISRLRTGIINIRLTDFTLKIKPLTLEQEFHIQERYMEAYKEAQNEGFLTKKELLDSLRERGLWTEEDEKKEEGLQKDIEKLKVELFQNKNKSDIVSHIRRGLKAGKEQLNKVLEKKFQYFENSCEGLASIEKVKEMISISCFKVIDGGLEKYDFEEVPADLIVKMYSFQMLGETSLRELARSEPWRSAWLLRDSNAYELFDNKGGQLTPDQKGLLTFSRMYDNVQESMECPSEDVIEDDDMLDGWFILQKRKRDSDRAKSEVDQQTANSKISNSDEIFVMASSKKDAERINNINSITAQKTKERRFQTLKKQGQAVDSDFEDQKIRLNQMANEQFKGKFRR